MEKITFIIASHSFVINRGVSGILRDFKNVEVVQMVEDVEGLHTALEQYNSQFVIISTDLLQELDPVKYNALYQLSPKTEYIHLQTNPAIMPQIQTHKLLPISYSRAHTNLFFQNLFKPYTETENRDENEISDREKVILALVAKGKTNKEIAEELNLSIHTVVTHRKNITHKLGIKSISGLTVYAIFNGLISMDEVK